VAVQNGIDVRRKVGCSRAAVDPAEVAVVAADLWLELLLVAVLIAVNAALAGSEVPLVSLREGQIDGLGGPGRAGRTFWPSFARDPCRFLATIRVGITLARSPVTSERAPTELRRYDREAVAPHVGSSVG
jgi:hypothetical protein